MRTFGPISLLTFLKDFPYLAVGPWTLQKPVTLLSVLARTDVEAMRKFLEVAPREVIEGLLPVLLHSVDRRTVAEGMSTVINASHCHKSLLTVLKEVDFEAVAEILKHIPPQNLRLALAIPAQALAAIVRTLDPARRLDIMVEVLTEPESVLEDGLVPLLQITRHPDWVAMVANHVDMDLLLCFVRAVRGRQLATFIDASWPEDFHEDGAVTTLMAMVQDDPEFVAQKLVPLFKNGDAVAMAMLVHAVEPRQLLDVLRRVEVEGVLCLLANTNEELVIRIMRGPLDHCMSEIAGVMATEMQKHPHLAAAIAWNSDQLVKMINNTKEAKRRIRDKMKVLKGKAIREAAAQDLLSLGDLSRGVPSRVEKKHEKDVRGVFSETDDIGRRNSWRRVIEQRRATADGRYGGDSVRQVLSGDGRRPGGGESVRKIFSGRSELSGTSDGGSVRAWLSGRSGPSDR